MSDRPINSHYDDDPAAYAALRASWMADRRVQLMVEFLVGAAAGASVLELGAGTGDLLLKLASARPDLRFVGVEPLDGYVEFARQQAADAGVGNVEFVQGYAEQPTELERGSFDRVVSVDVLHHVADVPAALRNAADLTKPGAQWQLVEPSWLNPYVAAFQGLTKGERNFVVRRDLRNAGAAGWALVDRRYALLIPARVKDPAPWMKSVERRLERFPVLGGAVLLRLERR